MPSTHTAPLYAAAAAPDAIALSQRVVLASMPFAKADDGRASWQIGSVLAALAGLLTAVHLAAAAPWRWLLILPLTALMVRVFVLQHDCGHRSLFRSGRWNDAVGTLLGFITGVAFEAWRTEHNWHHGNQAKLSHRGVDRMNSPMTVAEARERPDHARMRRDKISIRSIFVLGAISLGVLRRVHTGYFPFRERFRWPVRNGPAMIRSVRLTNLVHAVALLALGVWIGPVNLVTIILPTLFAGAGCGSLLFWVQHNFEHTFHADDTQWSFVGAGLRGASYLRLPAWLRYVTADIGLHHVHHINSQIPNYRLEAARQAIPELRALAPLPRADFRRCFTHVFWDEAQGRMVTYDEVFA